MSQDSEKSFSAIVLCAGQGTRMASPLPKILHPVAGRPLIHNVIGALKGAGCKEVRAVVGHGEALVRRVLEPMEVVCCKQQSQLGTADAVKAASPETMSGDIMILNGDHPLITTDHLKDLYAKFKESGASIAVVSSKIKSPGAYGRIVRHYDELKAIVEAKDASKETLAIQEVNTGMYICKQDVLAEYLPQISNNNAQKEFYLTDLIEIGIAAGEVVTAIEAPREVAFGVNSQKELAAATRFFYQKKAEALMANGVVILDPSNTYIEWSADVGEGTVIYPGAFIKGNTTIGSFCVLEPNVFIQDSKIAKSVQVRAGSYLEQAQVGDNSVVGPYARLRPETILEESCKVGNFVEMKKTKFGAGSKAGHLTYLGDAEIGKDVNIGCGTITCNYAANKKKYKTKIGDGAFIGSDSQFVAPVEVGAEAIVGSGSTITQDVPAGALAVARGKQTNIEGYAEKLKNRKDS